MFAIIENATGTVLSVEQTEIAVAPDWSVIPCPDDCDRDWTYANGEFIPPVVDIDDLKADMIAAIDVTAEGYRSRGVTSGLGQADEYEMTFQEALAYDSEYPDSEYPMLVAERDALADGGVDKAMSDIASEIVSARNAQILRLANIKRVRRSAKISIRGASSVSEINNAFDNAIAQFDAL